MSPWAFANPRQRPWDALRPRRVVGYLSVAIASPPRPTAPQGHWVCDAEAASHCPAACLAHEPCYGHYLDSHASPAAGRAWRSTWNRIQRFDAREALCLSRSFFRDRQRAYDACVARAGLATARHAHVGPGASGRDLHATLGGRFPDFADYRLFSADCEAILTQVLPMCHSLAEGEARWRRGRAPSNNSAPRGVGVGAGLGWVGLGWRPHAGAGPRVWASFPAPPRG